MPRGTTTPRTSATSPTVQHRTRRWTAFAVGAAAVFGLTALIVGTAGLGDSPTSTFSHTASAEVNGVRVEGSEIQMGKVPLNKTVSPAWTIENTSGYTVELGEPHAAVIEGCCPGQLLLEDPTLEPGETTRLVFPLQMHPGMDGPHDFDIHIPVGDGEGEYLTLGVKGDFGG